MNPTEHTPTRCKDCLWIDEVDTYKKTSFRGIEFCIKHNRAVNSHEALLLAAQSLRDLARVNNWTVPPELDVAIAQAEGKS
jgi:hypothetical protein